ncbi:MAG: permease [Clostridia bacterium]
MFTIIIYIIAAGLLFLSFLKDKRKTKLALKKAWKAFENILPIFIVVLIIIGITLALLNTETISRLLGQQSGWFGMVVAAFIGSVTLIPGFVTFPLASALLHNGAGFMQIAVFISTSMMVGIVTLPLEVKYFSKKAAVIRNSLAIIFSFVVAIILGMVIK